METKNTTVELLLSLFESGAAKPERPRTITICGSVRFMPLMLRWACYWTRKGFAILMPHCTNHKHYHSDAGNGEKEDLDILHFKKIGMSDFVFVVNPEGYIGESTAREIRCAKALGIPVIYSEKMGIVVDEYRV